MGWVLYARAAPDASAAQVMLRIKLEAAMRCILSDGSLLLVVRWGEYAINGAWKGRRTQGLGCKVNLTRAIERGEGGEEAADD